MKNKEVGVVPDDCFRSFKYLQDFHKISSLGLIGEVFEIILNSIVNITTKIHHKNGGAGSA